MKKRPTYFPCLEFASVIKVVMKTTGFFYLEKLAINKSNIIFKYKKLGKKKNIAIVNSKWKLGRKDFRQQ